MLNYVFQQCAKPSEFLFLNFVKFKFKIHVILLNIPLKNIKLLKILFPFKRKEIL